MPSIKDLLVCILNKFNLAADETPDQPEQIGYEAAFIANEKEKQ